MEAMNFIDNSIEFYLTRTFSKSAMKKMGVEINL